MCGINGFSWPDKKMLETMNHVTRFRGPDDSGVFTDSSVSLGHSRLSIIDLSPAGHQPMSNEDDTIFIVYNGEIYNAESLRQDLIDKGHKFKSHCDTEIILHSYEEYGLDCLHKFNGMWAFCIYDKRSSRLVLSRDRFGVKPLYYHAGNGRFIFSSMAASILRHAINHAPNDKIIMEYLAFNIIHHSEQTFFSNVSSLLPGHNLIYDLKSKSLNIHQWYILKPSSTPASREDIRMLFEDSVRLRTVSDVPVGSCLSGGVDSSSIVCLLNKNLRTKFNTFSLIAPGHALDESRYIKEVGRLTNTDQYFTTLKPEEFPANFKDFVEAHEEPVTGLSLYAQYCVMKLAHENGAKVLLDGQGGDEIFAGYIYYYTYFYYELMKKMKFGKLLSENIHYMLNFKNTYPQQFLGFQLMPRKLKLFMFDKFLCKWINHTLLRELCIDKMDERWEKKTLNEALALTLVKTSIPHLLRWEDKNSMRWSIESRVPFLDFNLVEAAMSVPSEQKLRNGRTKIIFKDAVDDILPDMIKNRKDKIGFAAPDSEFYRHPEVIRYCKAIIESESFGKRPYWNATVIRNIYGSFIEGRTNEASNIMKWINLEIWFRKYID